MVYVECLRFEVVYQEKRKKRSGGVESWQVLCERQKSLEVIQKNTLTHACVESKRYNEYDEYEKLESF